MSQEMFNEAVQALKAGQRRRSRDLFTRLLKTEPNNVDYWLWMSATVDTEKEQVFCLQKALKIDPNSIAVRRGLVMAGALSPDEAALPPIPVPEGLAPSLPTARAAGAMGDFLASPRNRELLLIGGVATLAVALVVGFGLYLAWPRLFPRQVVIIPTATPTVTEPPTITPTATIAPTACQPPETIVPATPLALYLCLTPPSTPLPAPVANSPSEDYKSMIRAYQNQNWTEVQTRFDVLQGQQVISQEPSLYFYSADALRLTGNYREAINRYRTALQKSANYAPAYLGKALAELATGSTSAAERSLADALNTDANYVAAYLTRAQYFSARGRPADALADAEQARRVAPNDPNVLARLAVAYVESGRYADAMDSAAQALTLDAGHVLAYYARGAAHYEADDYEAASQDLGLAIPYLTDEVQVKALFPIHAALNVNLPQAMANYYWGVTQLALGDSDAGLNALNRAIELRKDGLPVAHVARGQALLKLGQSEDARSDFNTAIGQFQRSDADNPKLNDAYVGQGQALLELDKAESAISNFQVVLRGAPERFDANLGLGRALFATGKLEDAVQSLTTALNAAGTDPAQQAQAFYWRAQALDALGRTLEAVADLQALSALAIEASGDLAPTAQVQLTAIAARPTATPVPPTATATARVSTPTRTATRTATPSRSPTPKPSSTRTRTAILVRTP
jgi:tetratricopeptide (TPR) repeat protein